VSEVKQMRLGCDHCKGEPEPGYIELLNNGPVVPCPFCNPKTQREIEYEKALRAREGCLP
jgi:hypothetical protein